MKFYTYHAEVKTLIEQFTAAFNDIVIKGHDRDGLEVPNALKPVRFIYAPKQRVFSSLQTPGPGGISVPAVAISMSRMSRDKSRVFNKNQGFSIPYNENNELFSKNIPQPVPVNVGINMSIITKYQDHMDQIVSNFVPYCDPYIIVSWKFPGLENSSIPIEIRSKILWSGDITFNYPAELQGNSAYRLTADTSFTIEGWLFKKMDEIQGKIFYINESLTPSDQTPILEELSTEFVSISATPNPIALNVDSLSFWNPNNVLSSHNVYDIEMYGKYFFDVQNIYLSASNSSMFSEITSYDHFSLIHNLSANNPPFLAKKITEFSIQSDHLINFTIPEIPQNSGFVDIIVENEAGYGLLSKGSQRPHISSWQGWTYEESAYANGIQTTLLYDSCYENRLIFSQSDEMTPTY